MKLAKWLRRLSGICFLLLWVPFVMIMVNGPLSIALNGPEKAAENMSQDFFAGTGLWIALTVGMGVASTVLMVASLAVGGLSNRRVIANGQDADARILAIADTGTRINNNPVVNFALEVHPPMQPAFRAQASQTVSAIHLPSFQPGKVVRVKYVPGSDQVAIVGVKPA
ncbi:MAG: hypothetical protein R2747_22535 [Pyrinomonadaceae bacterium]